MASKRKAKPTGAIEADTPEMAEAPTKRTRRTNPTSSAKRQQSEDPESQAEWPDHFHSLFKTFKAINMVLAFLSSKRQLATSFATVRSSVESLLHQPLEIHQVSEIKALLPDLVKFSYIPASQMSSSTEPKAQAKTVDYSCAMEPEGSKPQQGQVLVLDLADNLKAGKKSASGSSMPPSAVKQLIEGRNGRFEQAINELIFAGSGDDPVELLKTAATLYVPVNHAIAAPEAEDTTSRSRPPIDEVISAIESSPWYKDQVIHRRTVPPKAAQTGALDPPISQQISDGLSRLRNVNAMYSHQTAAISAIRLGKNVVVSTSTASGKSVIYQVPLLQFLEEDSSATAILVFPTKALAQDQKTSLEALLQVCGNLKHIRVATYDGDTPQDARNEIREMASVILTNFVCSATLHHPRTIIIEGTLIGYFACINPAERGKMAKDPSFMKKLKIFAVDELHYYTGVLGSHVAYILRRLRRVCAAVGNNNARIISCSATLANPAEYMSKLFNLDRHTIEVIENDGAPSGGKDYLLWNPPLIDEMDPSLGRKSSLSEASMLFRLLVKKGVRVILFCKIRKICELAMKTIKADLSNEGRADILQRVRSYRGGYSREDRRKIEREAFSGQLLGIIATNALELGIDIGALDAVIMLGFPMTVSNFKQQAGRAGRRSRDSLAIMVADPFPIDQHFVKNPSDLYENLLDDLILDLENDVIEEAHLQCAAYEMPLTQSDQKWFGPSFAELCQKRLKKDTEGWFHPHPKFLPFPSRHVSIRGATEEKYAVLEVRNDPSKNGTYILEEVEFSRALFELYEGGVFMHQGDTFIITELSHDDQVAKVVQANVNYHTSPRDHTRLYPLQTYRTTMLQTHPIQFGRLNVCISVYGFFKMRAGVILDAVDLMSPPWERESTGFWIDLPPNILQSLSLEGIDGAAAIHATEHSFLNQFALSQDIKTDCRVAKEDYSAAGTSTPVVRPPRLIFYDTAGKTGGVVGRAFDHVEILMERARKVVNACECIDGCKQCTHSVTCKDANLLSSKAGAVIILNSLFNITYERDSKTRFDMDDTTT